MTTQTLEIVAPDGARMQCFLALPEQTPTAAVVLAPEWWGLSEHVKNWAKKLGQEGYVALGMDLYGDAKMAKDAEEAAALSGALRANPDTLPERTEAVLQAVRQLPQVTGPIAAIGFCFGGKVVLDMARRGQGIAAVASFHGNLTPAEPAKKGVTIAPMLIEHGARDSMVSMASLEAFQEEMHAANVSMQVDVFDEAKHGFTNPGATEKGQATGVDIAYNAQAAEQSWENLLAFLKKHL